MTIVACVKVYDGLVLGADSATQITGKDEQGKIITLKVYKNAEKLFQLQDLPIGVLTYGIGNIKQKSIETLLKEFNRNNPHPKTNDYKVGKISAELHDFFVGKYQEEFKGISKEELPPLGFFIAGYSNKELEGEEWEFRFPDKPLKKVRKNDIFGSSWRGIGLPFIRLYNGCDPRLLADLHQLGISKETTEQLAKKYKSNVIYDGMPLKEAIKFARFILQTTISLSYFEIGPETCSEPIRIAVIEKDKPFKFIEDI